uniref:(northern house mosquito) hypothetical protein n=1 Tax=Culex pipiens TaxID=7175 RepID=A0A8D8BRI3_CULPI
MMMKTTTITEAGLVEMRWTTTTVARTIEAPRHTVICRMNDRRLMLRLWRWQLWQRRKTPLEVLQRYRTSSIPLHFSHSQDKCRFKPFRMRSLNSRQMHWPTTWTMIQL